MSHEILQEPARSFSTLFVSLIERPEENTLVPEELQVVAEPKEVQMNGHANHLRH